ncbi:MAG: beta-propeller fold lactonase family protein [Deltaproteobacteria bacterium]|nr:beta-propeller fold lactonase family protein [Deltaproteobacteria bacterium]
MRALALAPILVALVACDAPPDAPTPPASHSSSIAVSADGARVFVVNPDADSVSVIDADARTLVTEVLLADAHPIADPSGAFTPAVMPRALALAPDGATLYVTGERAGALFAVDLASRAVRSVAVGSRPIGVVVAPDGGAVFVACAQDATVVEIATADLSVRRRVAVDAAPWALGWASDGALLATHLLGPGVTVIDPAAMTVRATWALPALAPRGDRRLAHGDVRGLYDVAARPGTDEHWIPHVLLATDTAQPELDFESTVFPAIAILGSGAVRATLTTDAPDVPGLDGALADVVSAPQAIAFTPDGAYAIVADAGSEDLLAVDAGGRVQATLLRPLPGHLPQGLALSPDGTLAYVDERNTGDVAVVRVDRTTGRSAGIALAVEGAPIARLTADPMPAPLRLGQHVFYSANSDELPVTTNHWVSCASCHLEGASDAVTWRFEQGPRDTPSNAGGMLGTGFLFRTADRTQVQDYWHTIVIEQGGPIDPTAHAPLLDALAAYVNHGIPLPPPPTTDPARVARGAAIFARAEVGCADCHRGPRFTDSADGNPTLDLAGPIALHDVGTCATSGFADVPHTDLAGHPRAACAFDTPSLSGIASTPPYLHDGSAATLRDALERTRGTMGDISALSAADLDDLVEYLRSL